MAFNDLERKRVEKAAVAFVEKHRPPPQLRSKLDLAFRIDGQSLEIFEVSPRYDKPDEKLEIPVAKAKYVRSQDVWKVYWQRADLKWHGYTPCPQVGTVEAFLELVGRDEMACFFG
ncbi:MULTISPECIES: DUF3024 domain-containing protein [unclassified Halomonas]|uniref:DUF3024 domain-containing protein n=1 Tax=unclassified Halomonas TaxID=2609666 RepID=UPI000C903625|nr:MULTISPECIES: DUF3024 domain-containing protein [unclassified Halomonas]MAR72528.1 hypothetical protein [Halomonas sp.]MBR9878018.1 DUF3024 domain-containing protein [Gammaproteobacteria bacterium]|tara:strand:+ start:3318 stop:3665 length:348 start_codon:yes stop_codon:yes gene_type:complete